MVFLPPGTFGCQLFARAQRQAGNRAQVAYAETGTLPYLARKHGQRVVISGYATRLPTGVLPLRLADAALRRLAQAYPSVEPAGDPVRRADECRPHHPPAAHPDECRSLAAFRALGHPQ